MELTKRFDYVDLTKGIAIFLMVLCHCGFHNIVTVWIYSFHMPLFWILSGYLYNWNCSFSKIWIEKKFKQIIVPAILVCGLSCFGTHGLIDYSGIIYGSRASMRASGVIFNLWFLPCFFLSICLYSIIATKVKVRSMKIIVTVVLGCVGFMCSNLSLYKNWGLPYSADTALVGVLLMSIGSMFRNVSDVIHKNRLGGAFLLVFFVVGSVLAFLNRPVSLTAGLNHVEMATSAYGNPLLFVITASLITFSLLGFMSIVCHRIASANILYFLGKNSLGIYCMHAFVIYFCFLVLNATGLRNLSAFNIEIFHNTIIPIVIGVITISSMKQVIIIIEKYAPNLIGEK